MDIKTDTINAGKNIDLSTTNSGNIIIQSELSTQNGGYIRLNSAQSLVVDKNITSSDYLFLGAKEGLELSAIIQAVNDITMETQGGINQISGSVTSTAGKVLASNTVSGGIILNNVAAQTGMNITNTGDSAALVAVGNLVSAGGNLNIVNATGGNVDLTGNIESFHCSLRCTEYTSQVACRLMYFILAFDFPCFPFPLCLCIDCITAVVFLCCKFGKFWIDPLGIPIFIA